MKAREMFSRLLRLAISSAFSSEVFIAINSRSRRKPEREETGGSNRQAFTVVLCACLLINLSSAQVGFAKSKKGADEIATQYFINNSLEESNGVQIRRKLLKLLSMPGIRLFLDVIQKAEGGQPTLMIGGCRANSLILAALELIRRGGGAANASTLSGLAVKRRIQKGFIELLRGKLKSAQIGRAASSRVPESLDSPDWLRAN